jgi:hypothetical protein
MKIKHVIALAVVAAWLVVAGCTLSKSQDAGLKQYQATHSPRPVATNGV